jgi:protein-S-isoprenylcysteine O-methyltransferase Ste14
VARISGKDVVRIFGTRRAVVFWLGVFAAVLVYEEPTLRELFGEEYRTYCENVPRWIPRLTAYTQHRPANG